MTKRQCGSCGKEFYGFSSNCVFCKDLKPIEDKSNNKLNLLFANLVLIIGAVWLFFVIYVLYLVFKENYVK